MGILLGLASRLRASSLSGLVFMPSFGILAIASFAILLGSFLCVKGIQRRFASQAKASKVEKEDGAGGPTGTKTMIVLGSGQ